MRKFILALLATIISVASYAAQFPSDSQVQGGPVCPENAPCEYSGPAKVLNPSANQWENIAATIKVISSGNRLIGTVVSSSSKAINNGESGYVKNAPSSLRPYTHYFMANGYWFCFKL